MLCVLRYARYGMFCGCQVWPINAQMCKQLAIILNHILYDLNATTVSTLVKIAQMRAATSPPADAWCSFKTAASPLLPSTHGRFYY
jgi:hypothetical protein